MAKPDENERRNTPADWPPDSLQRFDFVTGCMWFGAIVGVALVTWSVVLIARRFL